MGPEVEIRGGGSPAEVGAREGPGERRGGGPRGACCVGGGAPGY